MCGIVGIVGDLTGKEEKIFKDMLILDTLRGIDSTGVAVVGSQRDVKIAKTIGDTFQLFDTAAFNKSLAGKNHVLIGHNRWGTIGKNIRKNAHPFEFDGLVGVHNGTLKNKYQIPDHVQFDTDSEALYNHINKVGIDDAMEKVDGAYALVWYDKEDDSINFLRNKERPMTFAFSEDNKALFYASEAWMISIACLREGYKIKDIQELPEDHLYSFKVPATGQVFEKAKVRHIKPAPFHFPIVNQICGDWRKVRTNGGTGTEQKGEETKEKGGKITTVAEYLSKALGDKQPEQNAIIQNMRATHYSRTSTGSFFVVLKSIQYPRTQFRVHMHNIEECRETVNFQGPYIGQVGITTVEEGTTIAKIRPDTFLEDPSIFEEATNIVITRKPDHKGNLITKEDFTKRYTTCGWCCAEVSFESNFHALGHNEILCEDCASDPEVLQDIGVK